MLRSMYSGISGMKNFQTKLDVIGNNIANVNTVGFKKGRITFQDMMSQMTHAAQGPTTNNAGNPLRGGVNAAQVGLGSQLGSIDNIHTQGFRQTTNNPLDFSLEGDGMFVLASGVDSLSRNIDLNNASVSYTRAGNFYLDNNGSIVNPNGLYLVGYPAEVSKQETVVKSLDAAGNPISISTDAKTNDIEITTIDVTGKEVVTKLTYDTQNLQYLDENGAAKTKITIQDETGGNIVIAVDSTKGGIQSVETTEKSNSVVKTITKNTDSTDYSLKIGATTIDYSIDNDGDLWLNDAGNKILFKMDESTGIYSATTANGSISYTVDGTTITRVNNVNGNTASTAFINVNEVFKDVLNHDLASTLTIPDTAQSFSVQTNGTVTYVDELGNTRIAGQVALASFSNPAGLEKAGSNLFLNSQNAGYNGLVIPEEEGASIVSGALEMSNVDLAEEFTEMITAQRGFQANTRIITTSDEILQELVNLKR